MHQLEEAPVGHWTRPGPLRVLHVGCGIAPLPEWLQGHEETRLDLNPEHEADVVADMTTMGDIGTYDAIYCSHALEHLSASDAARALTEFHRVLNPGGYAAIFVPDLEGVHPTEDILYVSPAGPVSGLDLIYGFHSFIGKFPHMQHRTGFIRETLDAALQGAGFTRVIVNRISHYNLMGVGIKG